VRVQLLDVAITGPFVRHQQADLVRNRVHDELGEDFGSRCR
jgi:hypothetical protein